MGQPAHPVTFVDDSIAAEAVELVNGARSQAYGPPVVNMSNIARLWSVVLGIDVRADQVATCFALTKIARELNAHQRDNYVDALAYLLIAESVSE